MTDSPTGSGPSNTVSRILVALADLGESTAAALAQHAGIGYSTTTPKLRALEADGHAERFRTDKGLTMWRLTSTGRIAAADAAREHAADGDTEVPSGDITADAEPDDTVDIDIDAEPLEQHAGVGQAGRGLTGVPAAGDDMSDERPDAHSTEAAPSEPVADADPAVDIAPGTTAATPVSTDTTDLAAPEETPARAAEPYSPDDTAPTGPAPDPDATTGSDPDEPPAADPQPSAPVDEPATAPSAERDGAAQRRSPGSMRAAILDACEANPDRQYKVGELCKCIDQANEGTGAAKASQGAVYNAAMKLAGKGVLIQTAEKPATFQLTARTD